MVACFGNLIGASHFVTMTIERLGESSDRYPGNAKMLPVDSQDGGHYSRCLIEAAGTPAFGDPPS